MQTIVVGIDGSDHATAAARFAAEEARLHGARLRLVGSWLIPASLFSTGIPWPMGELREQFAGAARAAVDEAAAGIAADGLEIETVVREGPPAQILEEEAGGADLLVIGSRGLGGFRGMLLGSVSTHCAQHAPCPVTIVRPKAGED